MVPLTVGYIIKLEKCLPGTTCKKESMPLRRENESDPQTWQELTPSWNQTHFTQVAGEYYRGDKVSKKCCLSSTMYL